MVCIARPVLKFMNLPDELMEYAYTYCIIVGSALFTQALIATMSGVIRSYGFTKLPMFVAIGMNIVNVIGNYFAIFRPFGLPQLGVKGVAYSLVISEIFGVIAISIILYKKLGIKFRMKDFWPLPWDILKSILVMGAPAAGEYINYSFSQFAVTYLISFLGAYALTTRVYLQNLTFFTYVLSLSIGQGAQILIGQQVGAGKVQEAYNTCIRSLKIAMTLNFSMSVICLIFRNQLIGLFTKDKSIVALAGILLCMDFILEIGRAVNHVTGNSLRGAGDVRYSLFTSIISMWGVSVALSFLLGVVFKLGMVGVWIAFTLDEWCRGILLYLRWRSRTWQQMAIVKRD